MDDRNICTHKMCCTTSYNRIVPKLWIFVKKTVVIAFILFTINTDFRTVCGQQLTTEHDKQISVISALVRYSYIDPVTGQQQEYQGELGRYATTSPVHPISGRIIHVQGEDGTNHGCTIPVNNPPNGKPWVALIQRGECKFREKIINSAVFNNATAVVIYNHLDEDKLITMTHQIDHVVSVFIGKHDGEMLANLADSRVEVRLDISIGQITVYDIVPTGKNIKPSKLLIITGCLGAALLCGLGSLIAYGACKVSMKKKNLMAANKTVFNEFKSGQIHESLISEIDSIEQSPDNQQNLNV